MTYDLIIISQSIGDLIKVTENCIKSARQDKAELNIIVVETGNPYKYDANRIVEYNGEFNYNRALNMGLKYAKSDIQILANNDLIFHPGWSSIGHTMKDRGFLSASAISSGHVHRDYPRDDIAFPGHEVGSILTGWCIFTQKELWEIIGKLDETFDFWYSDNIYAKQLKDAGVKHYLICNVQVDHITSKTLQRQPHQIQRQFTRIPIEAKKLFKAK